MGLKWYPHPEFLHCIKGCEVRSFSFLWFLFSPILVKYVCTLRRAVSHNKYATFRFDNFQKQRQIILQYYAWQPHSPHPVLQVKTKSVWILLNLPSLRADLSVFQVKGLTMSGWRTRKNSNFWYSKLPTARVKKCWFWTFSCPTGGQRNYKAFSCFPVQLWPQYQESFFLEYSLWLKKKTNPKKLIR